MTRLARKRVRPACLFLAVLVSGCHQSDASDAAAKVQPTIALSADELWARYRENDLAADELYAGANLRVSGTVAGIEQGVTDRPVILLASPEAGAPVRAEMAPRAGDRATTLDEGDQVVLRCQSVSELAKAPMLRNCDF